MFPGGPRFRPEQGGQESGESSVFGGGPKVDQECTMLARPRIKTHTHGRKARVCESRNCAIGHLVENGVLGR